MIHQLQTAASQLHGQHIDALVIAIGANDIGFASIIYQCAGDFVPSCDQDTSPQATTDARFAARAGRYAQLAQAIDALDVGPVYIEQYFDPTHGNGGAEPIHRVTVKIAGTAVAVPSRATTGLP